MIQARLETWPLTNLSRNFYFIQLKVFYHEQKFSFFENVEPHMNLRAESATINVDQLWSLDLLTLLRLGSISENDPQY